MKKYEFGKVKKVELREMWSNEAQDFTPWLADNISELGKALGMDLELNQMEAPVGDFALDILAKNLSTNHPVIIENQLSGTDHDHLGKLITYAAGYKAASIVWIAKEMREEHRQAIDWLNLNTVLGVDFYGIEIELFKIEDSKPAFNFKLVAYPNTWTKDRGTQASGQISPKGKAYQAFFQALIDELREKHRFTNARAGQPQNWCSFASGCSSFNYSVVFCSGRKIRFEVYIGSGDAEINKTAFDDLQQSKSEIEAEFGDKLKWERLDDRQSCRVAFYRDGSIEDGPEALEDYKAWMVGGLLKLKKVIGPRLISIFEKANRGEK